MPKGRMGVLQSVFMQWANIPTRITCVLVLLFQCAILDYYLISNNDLVWCLWAVPDLLVVALFIAAFVISYKYLHSGSGRDLSRAPQPTVGGELPLGYIAWGVYAVFLSTKIAIIFGMPEYIAQRLPDDGFFGMNLLKTTISLSSIIYLLLIVTHHDAKPDSGREALIKSITSGVAMDILDTVQFLDVLFIQKSHIFLTFSLHRAILAVACINLLLPTILLLILSRTHYGRGTYPKKLKLLHMVLYLLAINLPMLIIRLILWHVKKQEVSVFTIKNVIGIGQTVLVIHEHMAAISEADGGPEEIQVEPSSGRGGTAGESIPMRSLTPAAEGEDHPDQADGDEQ